MALEFGTLIAQLYLGRGVLQAGLNAAHAITIYSGAKPTAATIAAGFSSYNSGNAIFLAHYQGAVWTLSSYLMSLTTIPASVNASNTGTGTWAILWVGANPALGSMGGAIPTTDFIVVDVSDSTGDGVIRFSDVSFTSGVGKAILDGSMGAVIAP